MDDEQRHKSSKTIPDTRILRWHLAGPVAQRNRLALRRPLQRSHSGLRHAALHSCPARGEKPCGRATSFRYGSAASGCHQYGPGRRARGTREARKPLAILLASELAAAGDTAGIAARLPAANKLSALT